MSVVYVFRKYSGLLIPDLPGPLPLELLLFLLFLLLLLPLKSRFELRLELGLLLLSLRNLFVEFRFNWLLVHLSLRSP